MPDSFLGLFGFSVTAGRSSRRNAAQFFGDTIDDAELDIGKLDPPIAVLGLGNGDRFADQGLADEDVLAPPFDLAVAADAADLEIGSVARVFDLARIRARRGLIVLPGRLLAQGFMRSILIEVAAEAIEARLLRRERRGRRIGGLGLERAMHALVRPFCCGAPGSMRSRRMPSLTHWSDKRVRPPAPVEAKGGPLSLRMARGRPSSRIARSTTG